MLFLRWFEARPISWAAVGFLGGVLLHASFPFDQTPHIITTGAAVLLAGAMLLPVRFRWVICAGCLGVGFGLWRFDRTLPVGAAEPHTSFTGMVTDVGRYDVLVRDDRTGMVVSVSKRARIGEQVRVSCANIDTLAHEPKSVFDARKGAWFKCRGGVTVSRIANGSHWNISRILAEWRTVLTQRIQGILPGDAGALLSGILYGERGLSAETSALFKTSGMTHLIAVSGSNIAIVISLFVPCFLMLGYRRKPAIVLSGLAVSLFVVFVGAQASVIRAALMGWLALLARVFGRKASAGRLLIIAAVTIVLVDPWALTFDAGFALSFLATWGLLSWSRPFQERIKLIPEFFGLREAASTTLAATLVTFPYSLWAFGSSSLIGLLTNLFAVPIGGLAMIWGAVAVVLGPFLKWATLPARGCLEAMLAIAQIGEHVPWLQVAWTLPTWGLFSIYVLLMAYSVRHTAQKAAYPQEQESVSEVPSFFRSVVAKK